MAGTLYYSPGDPDLLTLLVLWEVEKSAVRYELVEGGHYLEISLLSSHPSPLCEGIFI